MAVPLPTGGDPGAPSLVGPRIVPCKWARRCSHSFAAAPDRHCRSLPSRTSRSGGVAGPRWAAAVVVDDDVAVVPHLQVGVDEARAEDTSPPSGVLLAEGDDIPLPRRCGRAGPGRAEAGIGTVSSARTIPATLASGISGGPPPR